jgi:hypothetical protein
MVDEIPEQPVGSSESQSVWGQSIGCAIHLNGRERDRPLTQLRPIGCRDFRPFRKSCYVEADAVARGKQGGFAIVLEDATGMSRCLLIEDAIT